MSELREVVREALSDWGEYPCMIAVNASGEATEYSASTIKSSVDAQAHFFRDIGVRRGTVVLMFRESSVDFVVSLLALFDVGAIPVPVKSEYRSFELDSIIDNARPDVFLAEEDHLALLAPHLSGRSVIAHSKGRLRIVQRADVSGIRDDIPPTVASINYTYRGYGYPLGALLPAAPYIDGARKLGERIDARAGERLLSCLPMANIVTLVGCVFLPLLRRLTAVVVTSIHPGRILGALRTYDIAHVIAVPEVYALWARATRDDQSFPKLRALTSGGSTLSPSLQSALIGAFGVDVLNGYGLTEYTPISCNRPGNAREGTIGPLFDNVTCRIDRANGNEILVKVPGVAHGYYRGGAETGEAFVEGWFRTGDRGSFENDHLIFESEIKRTMKINGAMVDLEEVKRAIEADPAVQSAEVNRESGRIVARIVPSGPVSEERESVKALRARMKERIAPYKVPATILFS